MCESLSVSLCLCASLFLSSPSLNLSLFFYLYSPTLTFPFMSHRSLLLSLLIIYSFLLFYCATGVSLQNLDEFIHYITTKSTFASVYSLWFVIVPSSSFVYLFHRSFFFFRLYLPPFLLLLSFISSTVPSSSFVYIFHRSFFFFRLYLPPFLLPAMETSFFNNCTRVFHFFVHLWLILFISK